MYICIVYISRCLCSLKTSHLVYMYFLEYRYIVYQMAPNGEGHTVSSPVRSFMYLWCRELFDWIYSFTGRMCSALWYGNSISSLSTASWQSCCCNGHLTTHSDLSECQHPLFHTIGSLGITHKFQCLKKKETFDRHWFLFSYPSILCLWIDLKLTNSFTTWAKHAFLVKFNHISF